MNEKYKNYIEENCQEYEKAIIYRLVKKEIKYAELEEWEKEVLRDIRRQVRMDSKKREHEILYDMECLSRNKSGSFFVD
jgi:hypothetical protein